MDAYDVIMGRFDWRQKFSREAALEQSRDFAQRATMIVAEGLARNRPLFPPEEI